MEESNLPRIIHAIWAGGAKPLPPEGVNNLAEWALYNPNFTVQLWVDTKQPPQDLETQRRDYLEKFNNEYDRLYKEKYGTKPDVMPKFIINDIREPEVCLENDDLVDYCLDRIIPNYGMSSDILRYRILYKYGGVYVDVTDVRTKKEDNVLDKMPKTLSSESIAWEGSNAHTLFIEHLSQKTRLEPTDLRTFKIPTMANVNGDALDEEVRKVRLGNDAFICTKGNPLMLKMLEVAEQEFKIKSLDDMVMMICSLHNAHDSTIEMTGPYVQHKVIRSTESGKLSSVFGGCLSKQLGNDTVLIRPIRCEQYQLTSPVRNTRHWNNISIDIRVIKTQEDAFRILEKMIRFEIEHMGILRLDDHLRDLRHVAKKLKEDPERICIMLLGNLDRADLPLKQVKVVQNLEGNPLIQNFYKRHQLTQQDHLQRILDEHQAFKFYKNITCFSLFKTTPMFTTILEKWKTSFINEEVSPGEQRDIFDKIERAVSFIYYVKNNPAALLAFNSLLELNKEIDITNHLGAIMNKFTEAFLEPNKEISKSHIGDVIAKLHKMGVDNPVIKDYLDIKEVLQRDYRGDPNYCLRNLANKNDEKNLVKLLKYFDMNVNSISLSNQQTALHYAAKNGHIGIVKLLLQHGADATLMDKDKNIPGDIAHNSCQDLLPRSGHSVENKK